MSSLETGQIVLIILIISAYLLFSYCMYYIWWYHFLPWETTQGEVKEVKYEEKHRNIFVKILIFPIFIFSGDLSLFRYWKPIIEYSYKIKEEDYDSNHIRKPELIYVREDQAKAFTSKYGKGQKIEIYFVNGKPQYSMLIYEPENYKYFPGAIISALILIPSILVLIQSFL